MEGELGLHMEDLLPGPGAVRGAPGGMEIYRATDSPNQAGLLMDMEAVRILLRGLVRILRIEEQGALMEQEGAVTLTEALLTQGAGVWLLFNGNPAYWQTVQQLIQGPRRATKVETIVGI